MTAVTRRALFAVPALAAGKKRRRKIAMQPDQSGVFFQLVVVGGGEFTYDAAGNLRTANVGQTVTDPLQGITCYAGFSTFNGFGAVISLFSSTLDAQLWYADTGSSVQGSLTASITSAGGTDPFGNAFFAGVSSYTANLTANLAGGAFELFVTGETGSGTIQQDLDGAGHFAMLLSPPQQGTMAQMLLIPSQWGSKGVPQIVIVGSNALPVPATTALLEVQGQINTTALANIVANGGLIAQLGDVTAQAGNLIANTAGKGLQIKGGSNARAGTGQLNAGQLVVADNSVTANTLVFVFPRSHGANSGFLSCNITAGTGFTIISSNNLDANGVSWLLVELL